MKRKPLLCFNADYDFDPIPDRALSLFHQWRNRGSLGFMDLPENTELLKFSIDAARDQAAETSVMIVVGIGGSSLGLKALLGALEHPSGKRVIVIDSPDSRLIENTTVQLDSSRTAVTVITKSGGTSETLCVFMKLHEWLKHNIRNSRITAITDPLSGDLRHLASEKGWRTLPVPPDAGGRFSVLSPVGMYPAAFAGIDVKALLKGACTISGEFDQQGMNSLAGRVASAFFSRFESHPIHIFMPYSNYLMDTASWFAQLWAESLGKKIDLNGSTVHAGQTPLACRGPADQHSLLQLFMEGPDDKIFTFVTVPEEKDHPSGQVYFDDFPSMSYLEGRSPDVLRNTEAEATGKALCELGLPVGFLRMKSLDAESLGELLMTLEIATVLTGLALNINPLDQPGVERSKVLTYHVMGRSGY